MEIDIDRETAPPNRTGASGRARAVGVHAARTVLGAVFCAAGLAGFVFLFTGAPAAAPGLAGEFQDVFFRSHWAQFVDGVQLLAGLLLLCNRYVPLALTLLGAVMANIFAFHITMQPQTILAPIVVLALWLVLAYDRRASLAPLFRP